VEETNESKENHRPAGSHWQTLSHYAVSSIQIEMTGEKNYTDLCPRWNTVHLPRTGHRSVSAPRTEHRSGSTWTMLDVKEVNIFI
jgi:hypothetical protein